MKRTRRGALALMAGSATALVVDTAGFSTAQVERDVQVEVVADDEALLGLTEDGGNDGDVLFEDGSREAPTSFEVINQTANDLTVEMTLEGDLEFVDAKLSNGNKLEENGTHCLKAEVPIGEEIEEVVIGIPGSELDGSNQVTDTIHFHVEGDGLQIDAERTVELEPEETETNFELRRGSSGGNGDSVNSSTNGTSEDETQSTTAAVNDEGKTSVDVDVTLVSGGTGSVWAEVEYDDGSGTETVDSEHTFELDGLNGEWNAEGDADLEAVVADTPVTVEVDPDGDPATVTVSVDE